MKTRSKAAILLVATIAFALAALVPVLPGPNAACGGPPGPGGPVCIPNQKFSVTQTYLGFGSESSYNGKFYYVCGLPNLEALTHLAPC
jgi:hypothetical protein